MEAWIEPPNDEIGRAIDLAYQPQGNRKMGLGWIIDSDQSTRWHNGATGGFSSAILVNRQMKVGVCILSNTSDSDTLYRMAERLFRITAANSEAYKTRVEIEVAPSDRSGDAQSR